MWLALAQILEVAAQSSLDWSRLRDNYRPQELDSMQLKRQDDRLRISFERRVEQAVAILETRAEEYIFLPPAVDEGGACYGPYTAGNSTLRRQKGDFFLPWPQTETEMRQLRLIVRTANGSVENLSVDF